LGQNFGNLAVIPPLVVTPSLSSAALYSIDMLPPFWRAVSLFNPVVYLSAVSVGASTVKATSASPRA
jgi:hypothetical protein